MRNSTTAPRQIPGVRGADWPWGKCMEVYKHDGTWLADTDIYGDNMSKQKSKIGGNSSL